MAPAASVSGAADPPPARKIVGSSVTSDAGVMSVRFSAAAISNAARYTNGLNTDPGWRRAETARLNCDWL